MLKKLFIWSTLGIILFWIGLILHVTYHHSFTKREKLSEPEWPAHVDFKMEKALIKNRNHVLNDLKEVFSCRLDPKKFLSMYGTLNMTWEDPLGRYEGSSDVETYFGQFCLFENLEFKIYHEVHSEQKIVLDWEHSGGFKGFSHVSWLKLKLLMRTHIFLEPGENPNNERILSIYEEWGGNKLLTEESLPWPPFLGLIHQKLRLFTGSLILSFARNIKSFV